MYCYVLDCLDDLRRKLTLTELERKGEADGEGGEVLYATGHDLEIARISRRACIFTSMLLLIAV